MDLVFDSCTGLLVDKPNVDAIFAIRQLTLMFSKILLPCSDARVEKAFIGYIDCEKEVRRSDANLSATLLEGFRQASSVLWSGVMQQVDEDIYYGRILPKHGPGATADRIKGNLKFDQIEWTERLERIFPYGEYALPNVRYHDNVTRVNFLEPGAERPVRVITVPKTLKTPRIIAIEPTCMQYMQQGILRSIRDSVERESRGAYTNNGYGLIGFEDQDPNRFMAQIGSRDGTLATLDLSEASDRVSNQLVRTMTSRFPHLFEGLDACRSRTADVPGHGVIRLAKFASMGSAVTFPIEAMVFSSIVMMGIASSLKRPLTPSLCEEMREQVRVYGDDIIVPVSHVTSVLEHLEAFGLKVNRRKSFWNGKFRESCGKEYYDGEDVSIARFRRELPSELSHVEAIVSTVSTRNQFYELGMWKTAGELDHILDEVLMGHYPVVEETSPVLGRVSASFGYQIDTMHNTLHAPLVKGFVVKSKIPKSEIDDVAALLKCFLKQGEEPFADKEHLRRGGRPKSVSMRLRLAQPF